MMLTVVTLYRNRRTNVVHVECLNSHLQQQYHQKEDGIELASARVTDVVHYCWLFPNLRL